MSIKQYQTNLNCGSCVASVTPHLNGNSSIRRWAVDTNDPRKVLTVEADAADLAHLDVKSLVAAAGFKVLGEIQPAAESPSKLHSLEPAPSVQKKSILATYQPLLLVLAYLVGLVLLVEMTAGSFHWMRAMTHFMGGFFVAFSFFKLLDLPGFVTSYQSYDVLARRSVAYGYTYPFIELTLGIAYLTAFVPILTNLVTLAIMVAGLVGVTQALLAKRQIKCACLGSVFNLPMSYVTFIEDGLMAVMAVTMLVAELIR